MTTKKATGHVMDAPAGLTTVESSDGFRHTSSTATADQMLGSLNLDKDTPEPAKELTEAEKTAAAAALAAVVDPLDELSDEELSTRADLDRREPKHLPRKDVVKQLVKRVGKRTAEATAATERATKLAADLEAAKKVVPPVPAADAAVVKVEAKDDEDKPYTRKKFEKARPVYKDPEDIYDPVALAAARTQHEDAIAAYYDERDAHNDEQRRLEGEHNGKLQDKANAGLAAMQRATAIIYDRGKARHGDYDQAMQAFMTAGGKWSPAINEFILQLGTADVDLSADVSRALVNPANRATVDRIVGLDRASAHTALSLFVARLPHQAAVKVPAEPAVPAETKPAGPAGVAPVSHAREPFNPGGTSPAAPVVDLSTPITAIPTSNFDAFMDRRNVEDGRNGHGRRV